MERDQLQDELFFLSLQDNIYEELRDTDDLDRSKTNVFSYKVLDIILPHFERRLHGLQKDIDFFQARLLFAVSNLMANAIEEEIMNMDINNNKSLSKAVDRQFQNIKNRIQPQFTRLIKEELAKKDVLDGINNLVIDKGQDFIIDNYQDFDDIGIYLSGKAEDIIRKRQMANIIDMM